MVTIERLNVQFDVEGENQDSVFASLFARHIREWNRHERERCEREKASAAARSLGDQPSKDF